MRSRRALVGVAVPLVLALGGCGSIAAAHATPPRAVPTSGSPSATASPTPTPSATPSPTPSPTPSVPAHLTVTALGDSVTAGLHCDCRAFPALFGDGLHTSYGSKVSVTNDGVSGDDTSDLNDELTDDHSVEASVRDANVVTVTIGANDFADDYDEVTTGDCGGGDGLGCVKSTLAKLGPRVTTALNRIRTLRGGQPTAVLVTGYWNVFEDGDVASSTFSHRGLATTDRLTRAANAAIQTAAENDGATYVDLYTPFKGAHAEHDPTALLADDGDHPNAAGHRVIARTLLAAGLAPLA